jgi:putative DNA primase/helicase
MSITSVHEQSTQAIDPQRIPRPLRDLRQWANWHDNKVIRDPHTGRNGSSTNPATHAAFDVAHAADPARLVFVFMRGGGLAGLDLDGCRDPETGALEPWAAEIVERFPDLYWETSLSGTGLHGIGYGELPEDVASRHPAGIGIKQHSGYFVMTGQPLPGHETLGAFGDGLDPWYHAHFHKDRAPQSAPPAPLSLEERDILDLLNAESNGKAAALLRGDASAYPSYSHARQALAYKARFYHATADQIVSIVLASGLFKEADREHDRPRKARVDAEKAVDTFPGPFYERRQPTPVISLDMKRLEAMTPAEMRATIIRQAETIRTLQARVERADEREAILTNKQIGAERQTGAALAMLFREEQPREPDSPTGYRMPLAKLAQRTRLSEDACSRHIKQLRTYKVDGAPLLHYELREIPRTVDQSTGEIIEPHKEIWIGPGVAPDAFGPTLATLAPEKAPKHGGKPDRNVCPDHPHAGTIRRVKETRKISHECAHCNAILSREEVTIGREHRTYIPAANPTQQDAFTDADAPPADPMPHDASPPETSGPIPQHAGSINSHTGRYLSRNMPGSYSDADRAAYYRGDVTA